MKDILTDIVAHTHTLGNLPLIKIVGTEKETFIESMAEDRSVVLNATTNTPVKEFDGVFGMPNLDKLNLHLKNPEYKEGAGIEIQRAERNGEVVPVGLHFENATGDFTNDYRFMSTDVVNEKLKTAKFKGVNWDIEFEPSVSSITRLRLQSQAHSEETVFQVKTDKDNLVVSFGDAGSHAGSFIFQSNVGGKMKKIWAWPVAQTISILALSGDKTIKISDAGAMMITVNSGLAEYNYILPAQTK